MTSILSKYAYLLTHYCLRVSPGDKVLISSTLLAEPLVRAVYREALEAGAALVETDLAFRERERLLMLFSGVTFSLCPGGMGEKP